MGEPPGTAGLCRDGGPSGATALLAGAITYALAACAQVAPEEMTLSTPCADWDLAALLAHLAASMADLESALRTGHLGLDPDEPQSAQKPQRPNNPQWPDDPQRPNSPQWPDDPGRAAARDPGGGAAVETLRDQAANLLFACYAHHSRDRFVLVGGLPLPAGIVACTGAVEIAVHGWDVSAARGRGGPIPPALATRMLGLYPLLVTGREGLFGAPVQVPSEASPGDQLVACLGRVPVAPG
jgi:uncharacterized protein (TIGR03086 family)